MDLHALMAKLRFESQDERRLTNAVLLTEAPAGTSAQDVARGAEQALQLYPDAYDAHWELAIHLRETADDSPDPMAQLLRARAIWEEAKRLDSGAGNALERANVLLGIATVGFQRGDRRAPPDALDEAEKEYEAYLRKFPGHPRALNGLGQLVLMRALHKHLLGDSSTFEQDIAKAAEYLCEAQKVAPERAVTYFNLLQLLHQAENNGVSPPSRLAPTDVLRLIEGGLPAMLDDPESSSMVDVEGLVRLFKRGAKHVAASMPEGGGSRGQRTDVVLRWAFLLAKDVEDMAFQERLVVNLSRAALGQKKAKQWLASLEHMDVGPLHAHKTWSNLRPLLAGFPRLFTTAAGWTTWNHVKPWASLPAEQEGGTSGESGGATLAVRKKDVPRLAADATRLVKDLAHIDKGKRIHEAVRAGALDYIQGALKLVAQDYEDPGAGHDIKDLGTAYELCLWMLHVARPWDKRLGVDDKAQGNELHGCEYPVVAGIVYDSAGNLYQMLQRPRQALDYGLLGVEYFKAARCYVPLRNALFNAGGPALLLLSRARAKPRFSTEEFERLIDIAAQAVANYKLSLFLCDVMGERFSREASETQESLANVLGVFMDTVSILSESEADEMVSRADYEIRRSIDAAFGWLDGAIEEEGDPLRKMLLKAGGDALLEQARDAIRTHHRAHAPLRRAVTPRGSAQSREVLSVRGLVLRHQVRQAVGSGEYHTAAGALAERAASFYAEGGLSLAARQTAKVAMVLARDEPPESRLAVYQKAAMACLQVGEPTEALDVCRKGIADAEAIRGKIQVPEVESHFLNLYSDLFSTARRALIAMMGTRATNLPLVLELLQLVERRKGYLLRYLATDEQRAESLWKDDALAAEMAVVAGGESVCNENDKERALQRLDELVAIHRAERYYRRTNETKTRAVGQTRMPADAAQYATALSAIKKAPDSRTSFSRAWLLEAVPDSDAIVLIGLADDGQCAYVKVTEDPKEWSQALRHQLQDWPDSDDYQKHWKDWAKRLRSRKDERSEDDKRIEQGIWLHALHRHLHDLHETKVPEHVSDRCEVLDERLRYALECTPPLGAAIAELEESLGVARDGGDVLLFVVPHDWTILLPWHLVAMPGGEVLADRRPLSYLPTAGMLDLMVKRRSSNAIGEAPAGRRSSVAVGIRPNSDDVVQINELCAVVGKDTPDMCAEGVKPGAKAEGPRNGGRGRRGPAGHSDGDARVTRDGVANLLGTKDTDLAVLVFHGEFLPDYPFLTHLVISDSEILTASDVVERGVAAKLVVLAACSSAVTVPQPGDDLLGFAQATLAAGARAVIAGAYEVSTVHTLALTRAFLQQYFRDDGTEPSTDRARALWRARRILRDHPEDFFSDIIETQRTAGTEYYHSGLVLLGDPF